LLLHHGHWKLETGNWKLISMTWIKICGITNLEDAQTAVEAGADALGFVFYEKSPRKIKVETAREIVAKLPARMEKVGVFVGLDSVRVREIVLQARLTAVQLHWKHLEELSTSLQSGVELAGGAKLIAAIPGESLKNGELVVAAPSGGLLAILVDSRSDTMPGGTGSTFDWEATRGMVQEISLSVPVIVAGGLTPRNVGVAIRLLQPFGVDVASGVEARPGKKDPAKVRAFVSAVRAAGKPS
jgi:phosphoribosylanthranilate isomerase